MKTAVVLLLSLLAGAAAAETAAVTVVTPDALVWRSEPAAPGAAVAVAQGDPKSGPYVLRVRFERGARSAPHRHPDTRSITVLSGNYWFATGTRYDEAALQAHGPGTLLVVPAGTPHFSAAKDGEVLVQENGNGPTALERIEP
ncbi:MAG TPA: cupin domain-containing protein [Solimonas sp.]|nr:cupin domain-containing protein [Solimonas sp.]